MDVEDDKKPSKINAVSLFGWFFVLVGVAAFCAISGPQILSYGETRSWQPVPAQISSLKQDSRLSYNDGKSTRNYSLLASYNYLYRGQQYQNSRVTLDAGYDSDEDYWLELERRIRRDNVKSALQVWINPDKPQESVLDRSFRWKKLIFACVFLLMFGGVGYSLAWFSTRQASAKQALADGVNGIEPSNHFMEKLLMLFGGAFLLLSTPVFTEFTRAKIEAKPEILFALLFPLVGAALFYSGIRARKRRKMFGPTLLFADPLPGCAGGQVGGAFEVFADEGRVPLKVRLECNRIRHGKNSSNDLIWQEHQLVYSQRSAKGSRHQFSIDVPDDLPPSESGKRSSVQWSVFVEGLVRINGYLQPFSRNWVVPVVAGTERTVNTAPAVFREKAQERRQAEAEASAAQQISLTAERDHFEMISRSGRNGQSLLFLALFGCVFMAFGIVPGYFALKGEGGLWVFAVVFTLIGALVLLASLWSWGRQLDVTLLDNRLVVVRSIFSKALYQRSFDAPSAEQLAIKSTMKSQTSGKASIEYFALTLSNKGKEQVLAEGIEGRRVAEELLAQLQEYFGGKLPEEDKATIAELF